MTNALILMKAMPPTKGHVRLLEWASFIADEVSVLIDTRHDEPMIDERVDALHTIAHNIGRNISIDHRYVETQDPQDEKFWAEWDEVLYTYHGSDFVMASESYGQVVADKIGARFLPYDPKRELYWTKAEQIRQYPDLHFDQIAREFQEYLRTTVTIFGAESTGKTTLSKNLARTGINYGWAFEYARPYLETVGSDIDLKAMEEIWAGQLALQRQTRNWENPVIIQDTDLFSTVGYWAQPHWAEALGPVPQDLITDAYWLKSDLYIICPSNIPFEQDSIRYGDGQRESPDEFWIDIAKQHGLNYKVLEYADLYSREQEAYAHVLDASWKKLRKISYDRKGL